MHYAALTLAVASAARPSEIFGSTTHPDRALRTRQIRFYVDAAGRIQIHANASVIDMQPQPHHLELELEVSKTDQRRGGRIKIISAATAVAAMWRHCCDHGVNDDDDRLFAMGGVQLTCNALLVRLKRELIADGQHELASSLSGRSFRRGGASTLSATGIDDVDIARLGWTASSNVGLTHCANDPKVQRASLHSSSMYRWNH